MVGGWVVGGRNLHKAIEITGALRGTGRTRGGFLGEVSKGILLKERRTRFGDKTRRGGA